MNNKPKKESLYFCFGQALCESQADIHGFPFQRGTLEGWVLSYICKIQFLTRNAAYLRSPFHSSVWKDKPVHHLFSTKDFCLGRTVAQERSPHSLVLRNSHQILMFTSDVRDHCCFMLIPLQNTCFGNIPKRNYAEYFGAYLHDNNNNNKEKCTTAEIIEHFLHHY